MKNSSMFSHSLFFWGVLCHTLTLYFLPAMVRGGSQRLMRVNAPISRRAAAVSDRYIQKWNTVLATLSAL